MRLINKVSWVGAIAGLALKKRHSGVIWAIPSSELSKIERYFCSAWRA